MFQDKKIKIIFLSSSEFGAPVLKKLAGDERFELLTVLTLPDKPKDRGMETQISPIKKTALDLGIKILEVYNMRSSEFLEEVSGLAPDIMVMASFGKIVPPEFLKIPPRGILNIHPSLLPKFRGPSPIQSSILADEEKTGVTIMLTDEKMDAGPIVGCRTSDIRVQKCGYKELYAKLAVLGAELICDVILDWVEGKIRIEPQDEALATYTKKITKEDGFINWNEPAKMIERKVRAFEAWPTAYFFIKKSDIMLRVQVLESDIIVSVGGDNIVSVGTEVLEEHSGHKTGEFFEINRGLAIQTGNGILKLLIVKPEGKKEMSGKDFLLGYKKYLIKN